MITHKTALYVRVAGDKFRPFKITRPTLQQVGAKLRIIGRRIGLIEKNVKEGLQTPPVLVRLKQLRDGMKSYLSNIGKEQQGEFPKSNNLRQGARKHNLSTATA